ncbi:MAG: oligosaccharide flippase family protein [Clostridia bacterium]|nr:oligosaccharide flippase family protein [Clostridia bacterium]
MTLTSLTLRSLGVAFNAFVSRELGADGMGLFTLIMSVYGLSVTVAASGVNLAATRMCAQALADEDASRLRGALKRCLTYAITCGIIACLLLFFGAELVASDWLGDGRCARSLRLLAVSLPFISASNVLHGYFTAVRKVSKSAATQIFEQVFKMIVTVAALLYIVPDGIEYSCMALVGGGALAEIMSFLMALILYLTDRRGRNSKNVDKATGRALTRELFGITVPVAVAAYVRSGLSTLEHMLIPRGLRKNPLTAKSALATYGVLCGMVMPIIMFPTALLYSFTGLLIPEFAEEGERKNGTRVCYMISRSLGLTIIFSIGCAALMIMFSNELGMLIYDSHDAGEFIRIMAPLIPLMYLDHAVDAILKGLGEQLYCMKVNIIDAAMCTLLVYLLCPRIGIYGYIVTIYIAESVNVALSFARLIKVSGFCIGVTERFLKPIICAVGSVAILRLFGLGELPCEWLSFIGASVLLTIVYILLLLGTGAVRRRDIRWILSVLRR